MRRSSAATPTPRARRWPGPGWKGWGRRQGRRRRGLRRAARAQDRRGDTEFRVWSTLYGLWLGGVAVPMLADARSSESHGVGLLLGGPVGYLAGRVFSRSLSVGTVAHDQLGRHVGHLAGRGMGARAESGRRSGLRVLRSGRPGGLHRGSGRWTGRHRHGRAPRARHFGGYGVGDVPRQPVGDVVRPRGSGCARSGRRRDVGKHAARGQRGPGRRGAGRGPIRPVLPSCAPHQPRRSDRRFRRGRHRAHRKAGQRSRRVRDSARDESRGSGSGGPPDHGGRPCSGRRVERGVRFAVARPPELVGRRTARGRPAAAVCHDRPRPATERPAAHRLETSPSSACASEPYAGPSASRSGGRRRRRDARRRARHRPHARRGGRHRVLHRPQRAGPCRHAGTAGDAGGDRGAGDGGGGPGGSPSAPTTRSNRRSSGSSPASATRRAASTSS